MLTDADYAKAPIFHPGGAVEGDIALPWDECPVCGEELSINPIPADDGPTRHYFCEHCTYQHDD